MKQCHHGLRRFASIGLLCVLWTLPAAAQEPPAQPPRNPEFERLQRKLDVGDDVTITGVDGSRVRGRLVTIAADRLAVARDGRLSEFQAQEVARVARRKNGVLLGAIIGAAAGAALSIPVVMLFENEGANATGAVAALVGIGTGAGIAVDAVLAVPRTVYKAPRAGVAVAPRVGPGGAGVDVTITF